MQHAVFAAFLIVEDELHGDAAVSRPLRMRRVAAVADQVTGVGFILAHPCLLGNAGDHDRRLPGPSRLGRLADDGTTPSIRNVVPATSWGTAYVRLAMR